MRDTHVGQPGAPAKIIFLLAAGLPLVAAAAYLALGARTPAGAPILPLDDAYIHLQYAWQAAHGQFLQYNPGETPTSGATSLLYVLLLAFGFLVGIGKEAMPFASLVFGMVLFSVSSLTLADLARRAARLAGVSENLSAVSAVVLFAGSGWMAWSFLSGMETGLLITLVIVALWATLARKFKLMILSSALAALTRPEALLLPAAILAAELIFRDDARGWKSSVAGMSLALSLAALPPAVNYFFTGSFSASGLLAKSLFTMVPFQWSAVWSSFSASIVEIWVRLFGGLSSDGHWHAFPFLQVLAIAGAVLLAKKPAGRGLVAICAAWLVLGSLSTATLQTATWHHYRYQMPFYPALVLLAAIAGPALAARAFRARWALWLVVQAPLSIWSLYSLRDFSLEYVRDTRTAAQMQLPLAEWLRDNTSPDARIAAHDIGIVRYFSGRATLDVVGLTSAGLAPAYRNGPGSLYESLEHLQPDFYAVYPNVAPPYFGTSSAAGLLGQELFRVHLDDYSRYTSAGDTQVVTRPDWSIAALADTPQQPSTRSETAGLALVDALDIADLASEKAHGYDWWNQGQPAGFPTDARLMSYRQDAGLSLADGGRLLTGGESFTLKVKPGLALVLVARLHQTAAMVLDVTVNQAGLGEWRLPAVPGEWLESTFTVSPTVLTAAFATVVLTVKDAPADSRYSPFYYWAYQGQIAVPPSPAPQHILTATFGAVAQLLGFDSSGSVLSPGQPLDLTLYWRAIAPDRANYRVFVHLTDPSNDTAAGILAQVDEAPRAGAFPFWVWPAGVTVREPVTLHIPPQARPGKYLLLAGVYDFDTGARLPISGAPNFGSNRLLLSEIEIR